MMPAETPRKRPTSQVGLGTMMLFVAVCCVLLVNLRILADHQDDLRHIWESAMGLPSSYRPPTLKWSDTPEPPMMRLEDRP